MQLVALQLDIVWENKPANHDKVRALLKTVKIDPEALIVLPEMFDTGFSMNIRKTAQSAARESEVFACELARQYNAYVLAGVTGPIRGSQASNQAVVFDPRGHELARYQKMKAFTPSREHETHVAGDSHRLFQWRDMTVAPFICYDLRFPEIFRSAAAEGAELFVVIASWPAARAEHWVRLLQARAIENQAFVVGVNRCGSDPNVRYNGRSAAFDPQGVPIFETDGREQVAICSVDGDEVVRWREQFPALRDMQL